MTASSSFGRENPCTPKKTHLEGQTIELDENCALSFPGFGNNDYGRSYTDHDGKFFVFAEVAKTGYVSKDYGSRTYYLLPVRRTSDFEVDAQTGELVVRHSSGETITLSKDFKIKSFTGVDYFEAIKSSDSNKGGLEIKSYSNGIILDAGWTHSTVTIKPQNQSTFIDRAGEKCTVGNKEIFDFVKTNPEEPANSVFKFPQREDLQNFLKRRCPKLDLTPLSQAEI